MGSPEQQEEALKTGAVNVVPGSADLDSSLRRLRHISSNLELTGLLLLGVTIVNVVLALLGLTGTSRFPRESNPAFLGLAMGMLALMLVTANERFRRIGEVLFQEISDELQWNTRAERVPPGKGVASERPPLDTRIALRAFARAGDLPLVPGRFGLAIYAGLNIIMAFIAVWRYTM